MESPVTGVPTTDPAVPPDPVDEPYGSNLVLVAGIAAFVAPFLSAIGAIALLDKEHRPRRRQQLKTWLGGSIAWLVVGVLVVIVLVASHGGGASGCRGGIDDLTPPNYFSSDGQHWIATYQCIDGGSTDRAVPASEVPGGGG
jgi:amino acid transporter